MNINLEKIAEEAYIDELEKISMNKEKLFQHLKGVGERMKINTANDKSMLEQLKPSLAIPEIKELMPSPSIIKRLLSKVKK